MDKIPSEIVEPILYCYAIGCFFYKFHKTKNLRYLALGIYFLLAQLAIWPLYLPKKLPLGLASLTMAGFVFYENYVLTKKESPLAFVYIFMFLGLGAILLLEAIFPHFTRA